jgi:hypothetical protein
MSGRPPHYTEFVADSSRLNDYQTVEEQQRSKGSYLQDFVNRKERRARVSCLALLSLLTVLLSAL